MKYQLIVTRDITESVVVEVETDDPHEVEELAIRAAKALPDVWEPDDGNVPGDPYVTDITEV
jgi:hypothetical protein